MNDVEFLVLLGDGRDRARDFWAAHEQTLIPPLPSLDELEAEHDRAALHQSYRAHLVQLRLLCPRYKVPKKGELPELDPKTGMVKANGYSITQLGRLLLRSIDADEGGPAGEK